MSATVNSVIPSRRSLGFSLSYWMALVGMSTTSLAPPAITLALRIEQLDPAGKNDVYALTNMIGMLITLVLTPLAGQLSDMTQSRFGMRRPWIAVSVIGIWLCALLLANTASTTWVMTGWALMSMCVALGFSPLLAIISEQYPESQQGLASGMAGTTPLCGVVLGSWLVQLVPQTAFNLFVLPAVVGGILQLQFLFVLRDRTQISGAPPFSIGQFCRQFYFQPRSNPSFAWLLLIITLTSVSFVVLQAYTVYAMEALLHIPQSQVAGAAFKAFLCSNGIGAAFSLMGGVVSDRIGRRKPLYAIGGILLIAGLMLQVTSATMPSFLVGCVVAGAGYGLVIGLIWALVAETSNSPTTAARDTGLVNAALGLSYVIISLVAPGVLRLGKGDNYLALYSFSAVSVALAILLLKRLRDIK